MNKVSFSKAQREAIGIINSGKIPSKYLSKKYDGFYYLFHNIGLKVYVSIIKEYQHTPSHYAEISKRVEFSYNLNKKR